MTTVKFNLQITHTCSLSTLESTFVSDVKVVNNKVCNIEINQFANIRFIKRLKERFHNELGVRAELNCKDYTIYFPFAKVSYDKDTYTFSYEKEFNYVENI